jgi:hypothetical protein
MCYEFSGWFKKVRAADQSRKEQQKAEAMKKPSEPAPPAQPVAPKARVEERETASV